MNTKQDELQVLGGLMKKPTLLANSDEYHLSIADFSSTFERIIFNAIHTLFNNGLKEINVIDIDNFLTSTSGLKKIFEQGNGIEYLQDALEFSELENFDYYYSHLKKLNLIKDLKKNGFPTDDIYCEDLVKTDSDEINRKFETLSEQDIIEIIKKKVLVIEQTITKKEVNETISSFSGARDLLEEVEDGGDIGLPIQGKIINEIIGGARLGTLMIRSGQSGLGKALPNSTKIPTPNGFKLVEEIQVGDYLFDAFGKPTQVLGVYPQGKKEVWQVTFKDGRTAKCCKEHLWSFCTSAQKTKSKQARNFYTQSLKEISQKSLQGESGEYKILVPNNFAVEYDTKKHFIEPYVMGLLLGDGSFREQKNQKALHYSSEDEELPKSIAEIQGWNYKKNSDKNYNWTFSYKDAQDRHCNVWISDILKEYPELINAYSQDKFIPNSYLYGDIKQRIDLLNGLLDSDGTIDQKGRVAYFTISEKMANQVQELCYSLGMSATIALDTHKETNVGYIVHIKGRPEDKKKLFRLSRKKALMLNWFNSPKRKERNDFNPIVEICSLKYTEEMTCFYVDNKEHLFLMNDYIVTHNTRNMVGDACILAFPYRYNPKTERWCQTGNACKVLYIATEQKPKEIQRMILAYLTGINESKFRYGNFTEKEKIIVEQAFKVWEEFGDNLVIGRMPNPTNEGLKNYVREQVILNQIEYVFYDYIFIGPALLNEFKGFSLRNDELLLLMCTSLKDIAEELNVFVMTATQVNSNADNNKEIRNEASLAGGRSTINKADFGFIMARPTNEELTTLKDFCDKYGAPTLVTDVFKVRSGEWNQVRVWSMYDAGTLRKEDLFVTNSRLEVIDIDFNFATTVESWITDEESEKFLKELERIGINE